MNLHPSISAISKRYSDLDAQLRRGKAQFPDLISAYSWVRKDGSLGMAKLGSSDLQGRTEPNAEHSIPFIITELQEDRDGDVVVPMGVEVHNYRNNPVVFFGHQENPYPIAKAKSPDGVLCVFPEENRVRSTAYFDEHDEDAMFVEGKVLRGFLSTSSMAFVPLEAYKRDNVTKAQTHGDSHEMPSGWLFKRVDLTEWSIVGVPSNAGAIRDSLDSEKSFISPRLQKALRPYAAKSRGRSFSGWCPPGYECKSGVCVKEINTFPVRKSEMIGGGQVWLVGQRTGRSGKTQGEWSSEDKFRRWAENAIRSGNNFDSSSTSKRPLVGVDFNGTWETHYYGESVKSAPSPVRKGGDRLPQDSPPNWRVEQRSGRWWVLSQHSNPGSGPQDVSYGPFKLESQAQDVLRTLRQKSLRVKSIPAAVRKGFVISDSGGGYWNAQDQDWTARGRILEATEYRIRDEAMQVARRLPVETGASGVEVMEKSIRVKSIPAAWLDELDSILSHTKGKTHEAFPKANVEALHAQGLTPKVAAVAVVRTEKSNMEQINKSGHSILVYDSMAGGYLAPAGTFVDYPAQAMTFRDVDTAKTTARLAHVAPANMQLGYMSGGQFVEIKSLSKLSINRKGNKMTLKSKLKSCRCASCSKGGECCKSVRKGERTIPTLPSAVRPGQRIMEGNFGDISVVRDIKQRNANEYQINFTNGKLLNVFADEMVSVVKSLSTTSGTKGGYAVGEEKGGFINALEHVEPARSREEAEQMVQGMRRQQGCVSARVIGDGKVKPFAAQGFFEDEPNYQNGMMTGTNRRMVPNHLLGKSLPRKMMEVSTFPTPQSASAFAKELRRKGAVVHQVSKGLIDKVRSAVNDLGFYIRAIQDGDPIKIYTTDPSQLKPLYQFLDSNGFDAQYKMDCVLVRQTGYTGKSHRVLWTIGKASKVALPARHERKMMVRKDGRPVTDGDGNIITVGVHVSYALGNQAGKVTAINGDNITFLDSDGKTYTQNRRRLTVSKSFSEESTMPAKKKAPVKGKKSASNVDRSELAIWAEGTKWSTDDLVRMYRSYCAEQEAKGDDPVNESRWASQVLRIPNKSKKAIKIKSATDDALIEEQEAMTNSEPVEETKEEESFEPKPSAKELATAHSHLKELHDYLSEKAEGIDHPEICQGLKDFTADHLEPAMGALKDLLHEHHGEKGGDPDELMEKVCKAIDGQDQIGEANLVNSGEVPYVEEEEDNVEEKSEVGSEEWVEEEEMEPEHKRIDEVSEWRCASCGKRFDNPGDVGVHSARFPEHEINRTRGPFKSEDDAVEKDEVPEDLLDASTEEILERYQHPKSLKKGWEVINDRYGDGTYASLQELQRMCDRAGWDSKTKLRQVGDRILDEDDEVVAVRKHLASTEEILERYQTPKQFAKSHSVLAKDIKVGDVVLITPTDPAKVIGRSVIDGGITLFFAEGDQTTYSDDERVIVKSTRRVTRKGQVRKGLINEEEISSQKAMDPACCKAADYLKGLAADPDMPEHHKAGLEHHAEKLASGDEGAIAKACTHMKAMGDAPDIEEHHKSGLAHHAKALGAEVEKPEEEKDIEDDATHEEKKGLKKSSSLVSSEARRLAQEYGLRVDKKNDGYWVIDQVGDQEGPFQSLFQAEKWIIEDSGAKSMKSKDLTNDGAVEEGSAHEGLTDEGSEDGAGAEMTDEGNPEELKDDDEIAMQTKEVRKGFYVKRTQTGDSSEYQAMGGASKVGRVQYSRAFPTQQAAQREADAWSSTGEWKVEVVEGSPPSKSNGKTVNPLVLSKFNSVMRKLAQHGIGVN